MYEDIDSSATFGAEGVDVLSREMESMNVKTRAEGPEYWARDDEGRVAPCNTPVKKGLGDRGR